MKERFLEEDINVCIKQKSGQVLMNEDCCTVVNFVLKNNGDLASSFFGNHNLDIVKAIEKGYKIYFRKLKKELKDQKTIEKTNAVSINLQKEKLDFENVNKFN